MDDTEDASRASDYPPSAIRHPLHGLTPAGTSFNAWSYLLSSRITRGTSVRGSMLTGW
jgi:hypothetical protein